MLFTLFYLIMKYKVKDKYLECAISDSNGQHILSKATQTELKKLYEGGHKDKIQRTEEKSKK